jgi:hypothetical protein
MIEKDGSMVGVGKLEKKPIRERKLHYIARHFNLRPLFCDQ